MLNVRNNFYFFSVSRLDLLFAVMDDKETVPAPKSKAELKAERRAKQACEFHIFFTVFANVVDS